MPRFFFHFKEEGHTHVDDVGHDLVDQHKAEEEAAETAASLLRDAAAKGKYEDVCVEVTNGAGFVVVTVCASIRVERKP